MAYESHHRIHHVGWLRAAVLGANDGIVSTASLVVGVAAIVAAIAYTGGPFPFGYHGLGDLFVFIFFGLVAVSGTYYVQALAWSWPALFMSLPPGLLTAIHLPDRRPPRRPARRSWPGGGGSPAAAPARADAGCCGRAWRRPRR